MDNRFLRAEAILGPTSMEKLRRSHVAVLGLGGVGSWCAEALARSGVGALTLLDEDTVADTNINRQSIATDATLGLAKAEAAVQRIRLIAPECRLRPLQTRYEAAQREALFSERYDYIVDAIDLVSCKVDLIAAALERGIPIVSALGTGNKLDAQQLRLCDISETYGCPLARVVRRELRRRDIVHHAVVFSPEEGVRPEQREAPPPGRRSVPGSLVWVTATAGMLLCQHVVRSLT